MEYFKQDPYHHQEEQMLFSSNLALGADLFINNVKNVLLMLGHNLSPIKTWFKTNIWWFPYVHFNKRHPFD